MQRVEHGLRALRDRRGLSLMTPRHTIGDADVYPRWQHNSQVRAVSLALESRFALA